MAVPAHDQRDFDFSKKYGMERIVVIQPEGEAPLTPENLTEAYTAPGVLVNSGEFDGPAQRRRQEGHRRRAGSVRQGQAHHQLAPP